jgi:hypothetical protein
VCVGTLIFFSWAVGGSNFTELVHRGVDFFGMALNDKKLKITKDREVTHF